MHIKSGATAPHLTAEPHFPTRRERLGFGVRQRSGVLCDPHTNGVLYRPANASRIIAPVRSISSALCAVDINSVSNCDGAK
jgi:hypothetical protein